MEGSDIPPGMQWQSFRFSALRGAATAETASTSAIHQLRFSAYLQSLAAKHMR